MTASMTKSERAELGSLIRKRERVMKAAARERSAQLLAEFDTQSATIYKFDDDDIWKAATLAAQAAAEEAAETIRARCRELGIPPEFAPGVSFGWFGRGQNAVAERRAELRRMAKSKIEKIEAETITKIEHLSLAAQTEIVVSGLESTAATQFLSRMPSVEELMPSVDVGAIKELVDARKPSLTYDEKYGTTEV